MTSIRTSQNYVPPPGESNFPPSETQPNDAMSVRKILEKFSRGLPVGTGDIGYYDDPEDIDMSDFDDMDPFEKQMYIREHRERLEQMEQRLKDEQKDPEAQLPVNSSAPQEQEPAEGGKPPESGGQ